VVLPIISRFGCRGGFLVRTSLKVGNLATTIIGGEGCLKGLVGCDGLVITARTAPPRVERKGNVWVESWTPALVLRCFRTSTRCCLKGTPLTSLSCVASPYCWRPFPLVPSFARHTGNDSVLPQRSTSVVPDRCPPACSFTRTAVVPSLQMK
jgi:hypothetical protein